MYGVDARVAPSGEGVNGRSGMTTAVRDTRNKGVTRADVAAAAAAVLDELGHDRLSMRQVAVRLGVTPMALYNHVESKDALLELVAVHLRRGVRVDEDLPPREQLHSLLLQLRDLGVRHPTLLDNPLALVGTTAESLEIPLRLMRLLVDLGLDAEQARSAFNGITFLLTGAAAVLRTLEARGGLPGYRTREHALRDAADPQVRAVLDEIAALPKTTLDEQLRVSVDLLVDAALACGHASPDSRR